MSNTKTLNHFKLTGFVIDDQHHKVTVGESYSILKRASDSFEYYVNNFDYCNLKLTVETIYKL